MRRALVIGLLLLAAAACSDSEPPQKEIDQAQTAVDLARAAGADKYAAEEYTAAVAGVQKAHAAVDQRDYRQALSYAIDARQRAQDAIRQTGDAKTKAQQAIDVLIADVTARAAQLAARLKTAEAARVPVKELRAPRAAVTDVQSALQEARTDIGAGNYDKAREVLTAVRKKLDAAIGDVENISPRPSKGGRVKGAPSAKPPSRELRRPGAAAPRSSAPRTVSPPTL